MRVRRIVKIAACGNQCGKTLAAAMELAMHALGDYPEWWGGHRFDRAIRAWACGETSEVVRETISATVAWPAWSHGTG